MQTSFRLAQTNFQLTFQDEAKDAERFCRHFFHLFLNDTASVEARLLISVVSSQIPAFPPAKILEVDQYVEKLLNPHEVALWIKQLAVACPILGEQTICASSLNGLLLFEPATLQGRIILLKNNSKTYNPLFRLIWIYLAQVLGEKESCFVHATALAKNGSGCLLIGESGAGKSTAAASCASCLVLSDDGPILQQQAGACILFASPFHQLGIAEGLKKDALNADAKAEAFYFLVQDKTTYTEHVSPKEAFSRIIGSHIHFFPYLSPKAKVSLFDLWLDACHRLPAYNLHFCRNQDLGPIVLTHSIYGGGTYVVG